MSATTEGILPRTGQEDVNTTEPRPATLAELRAGRTALLPHVDVVDGVVVSGEFAGATATRQGRWTCISSYEASEYGLVACFPTVDGWTVHNPLCSRRDAEPVRPLPKFSSRDESDIAAHEWNRGFHRPEWEITEAARKAAAKRAGEGT